MIKFGIISYYGRIVTFFKYNTEEDLCRLRLYARNNELMPGPFGKRYKVKWYSPGCGDFVLGPYDKEETYQYDLSLEELIEKLHTSEIIPYLKSKNIDEITQALLRSFI